MSESGAVSRGRVPGWIWPAVAALLAAGLIIGATLLVRGGDADAPELSPIDQVLDDPDQFVWAFENVDGVLSVVYSASNDAAVISGSNVPSPDATDVYQLWLETEDGTADSVAIFRPDGRGTVEVLLDDFNVPDGSSFIVSIEPAGGSDAPTDVLATSD